MRTTHPHGQNGPSRLNPGAAAMGALSRIPYFPGKGRAALLILRLYQRKLPLRARTPNGGWIWLADDDAGYLLLPYLIGKYEREFYVTFIRQLARMPAGRSFVDIGANVGYYTVTAAHAFRRAGLACAVHSFEPNPRAFPKLADNIRLNGFDNVRLNPAAVSDEPGTLRLHTSPNTITTGSLRPVDAALTQAIDVPVTTLDAYAEERGLSVGLIKIDIEGAELLALKGARRVIQRDRPAILFEEYEGFCQAFGHTKADVRRHLEDAGYALSVIRPRWPQGARLEPATAQDAGRYQDTQNILAVPRTQT